MILEQFNKLAKEFSSNLIEIRKKCETNHPTAYWVSEIIHSLGLEAKIVEEAGVVAELSEKNSPTKSIALRVALDDLSQVVIGLGTLSFLNSLKKQAMGQLRVLFYSEKTSLDFSHKLIHDGWLENVSGLWNLRTNSNLPCGSVGIKFNSGFYTFAEFTLTVLSKTSSPNVVPVTANVITALNQLTSRRMDPLKPAKIIISSIQSSGSETFHPNSVEIKGNYSTSDETNAQQITSLINESIQGLTKAYDIEINMQTTKQSTVTFNNAISLHLSNAANEVLGSDKVIDIEYGPNPSFDLIKCLETVPGGILEISNTELNSDLLDKNINSGFRTISWAFLKHSS